MSETRYCVQIHHPENRYRMWEREWTVFGGLSRTLKSAEAAYQALKDNALWYRKNRHFQLIKCNGRAIDGVEVLKECQIDNSIAYDPREVHASN